MKSMKIIHGIRKNLSYDPFLHQLTKTQAFLERGQREFPIDLKDSVQFLEELKNLYQSSNSPLSDTGKRQGNIKLIYLVDCSARINVLKAEMQMVLTMGNMEQYKEVAGFVELLQLMFGGEIN